MGPITDAGARAGPGLAVPALSHPTAHNDSDAAVQPP